MNTLSNRISLRLRIYLGFAVIMALFLVNAFIGYLGTAQLQAANESLHRATMVNSDLLTIDRSVQELRFRVSRYIGSGYESLRADILDLVQELSDRIETAESNKQDPEVSDLFAQMRTHIEAYSREFEKVVEEREIRASLVQETLPEISEDINEKFSALDAKVTGPESTQDNLQILRAQSAFSQSEKLLLRYFENPDAVMVDEALALLDQAKENINALPSTPDSEALTPQVISALEEYERTGIRAVQATRGYLYLVNVVMAGEASEVTYYSHELRRASAARQAEIADEMAAITTTTNRVTGAAIALALLLALLISARLAYLIVHPITALTATFKKLAEGESIAAIPGTERDDELGEMAKAARVFSNQNQNTRELLTRSENLREELKAKAEELEVTNADLDSFAYVASHDLKSPLRGIRQLSEWLEEDLGETLPPDSRKHLDEMGKRTQKMEALLDDLLQYSRVGRVSPEPEEVDLAILLPDVLDLIDNPENVRIKYPNELPRLSTVRVALEQVLLNLIGNAVKHNDRGSDGEVELSLRNGGAHYHFQVRDNGPGIDEKHHERVFQMYQRVGNTKVDGSGMGLAIVKKQIEQMGGTITLKSAPGEGAEFEFSWPAAPQDSRKETS